MKSTLLSEYVAWIGAAILVLVTAYYMIFGRANPKYKYQRAFGMKSEILGNKSAEVPAKVILCTLGSAAVCFVTAGALYANGL
jgi:hypothetical protein